jgi:hypothetical protein
MFIALEPGRGPSLNREMVVMSTPWGESARFYESCNAAEAGTRRGSRLTHEQTTPRGRRNS